MVIHSGKCSKKSVLSFLKHKSRVFLFVIGIGLGICFYEHVLLPYQNIDCFKGSYLPSLDQPQYLAFLGDQKYLTSNHNDVQISLLLKNLTSSSLMFTNFLKEKSKNSNSKLATMIKDVEVSNKKLLFLNSYYAGCGKNCHPIIRPLRTIGWNKVDEISQGRLVLSDGYKSDWFKQDSPIIQSWQRTNHIFNSTTWSRKDKLIAGIQRYHHYCKRQNKKQLYFIPESYRLHEKSDLLMFHKKLRESRKWQHAWWILTAGKNKERTMEIVKGNNVISTLLKDNKENRKRYLEPYICDQLLWKKEQNLLLRSFWLVASLDPLLVFYHDGYVRTGYNEKYYYHLQLDTNEVTFSELSEYLERNKPKVHYYRKKDPLQHVRNQIKESTALFVDAFKDTTFNPPPPTPTSQSLINNSHTMKTLMEDSFELYAFDFVLDKDLDVHLHTAWSDTAPSGEFRAFMNEDYYFLLQRKHEVYYSMILLLDDLWKKQASGDTVWPLKTSTFELVYAQGVGEDNKHNYQYQYMGYQRKSPVACRHRRKNDDIYMKGGKYEKKQLLEKLDQQKNQIVASQYDHKIISTDNRENTLMNDIEITSSMKIDKIISTVNNDGKLARLSNNEEIMPAMNKNETISIKMTNKLESTRYKKIYDDK